MINIFVHLKTLYSNTILYDYDILYNFIFIYYYLFTLSIEQNKYAVYLSAVNFIK